ncbi:MAG: hypothetical protein JNN15_09750 [Blastocatellia bacterium]|nr:hypothetical protein [Blastocatellia bacterium]
MKSRFWLTLSLIFVFTTLGYSQDSEKSSFFRPVPTAKNSKELADIEPLYTSTDPQQQIEIARQFLQKHPQSRLRGIAYRYTVAALIQLATRDQAVTTAQQALSEQPDNLSVMFEICRMGSEMAHKKDFTYAEVANEMGKKALALVESGSVPYEYSDEDWKSRKEIFLGTIHKSMGIMAFYQEKWPEAVEAFVNSTKMLPKDPYGFYLLAKSRYSEIASVQKPSQKKLDLNEVVNEVMKDLARAYVLSEQESFKWLHDPIDKELKYFGQALKLAKPVENYIDFAREETLNLNVTAPLPSGEGSK